MVFAKMLYDSGKMESVNYQIYLNWFNTFSDEFKVNKIIYVNTNPEICHERVGKRHRDGEDKIPLEYLKNCHEYHNNMLDKSLPDCVCKNQLILEGNEDIYENGHILNEWISSIEKFIYSDHILYRLVSSIIKIYTNQKEKEEKLEDINKIEN
jgi:deoxyadenosine/deoxycytidine kinase